MNYSKKYGKGWFNESYRHSLARQGIKTASHSANSGKKFIERQVLYGKKGDFLGGYFELLSPHGPGIDFSKTIMMDILDFEKARKQKPITEKKGLGKIIINNKYIRLYEKPLHPLGKFKDLFKRGNHLQIYNRRGELIRDVKKINGKIVIDPQLNGIDILEIDENQELYYEPWFMDYGSILFIGPKSLPGLEGHPIKLATENDKVVYVKKKKV